MDPEPERETVLELIKKGNKSSAIAMIGNAFIAAAKGVGAATSGSGAMFASSMHSLADSVNQGFVFVGSVLSEKKPTRQFPTGFGRVINIFCMVAVIVVTIMAYETVREGWHLIQHPAQTSSSAFWINIAALIFNLAVDGAILLKAMKEITKEARVETRGLGFIPASFKHVGRSAPPTRLVFYEDLVAVSGALLAMIAVVITSMTAFKALDGVVTILIGFLMVGVAFRVGYDNMVGLIGVAAPRDVAEKVALIILSDQDVTDINDLRITQEGRYYHVDAMIETRKGLSLADADDIIFRVQDKLIADPDITDVVIGIIEDNGVRDWTPEALNEFA
ncbi:cation diffusion facilitator family transporter [Paenibacillus alvei]|uniref:Cation diffusion facilitator family transporter n=1 Tax=Paenibacillus alvei TaxID=44250 RepID=A0ABT4GVU3_PAEAL|nr:cation diffusion facilitator family transporter [Paenibacillus alvei]MCY9760811.1 cation diffusion facilitator family transporter [Paenibacillus alvei]MCY9769038.1 cation diffusion facilitator family transporter [Paenibacillus alvei]